MRAGWGKERFPLSWCSKALSPTSPRSMGALHTPRGCPCPWQSCRVSQLLTPRSALPCTGRGAPPQKHRDTPTRQCPGRATREVSPVVGTRCPGWPQGGSGHLCPQDCPAGLGASGTAPRAAGPTGQGGGPGAGEGPRGPGMGATTLMAEGLWSPRVSVVPMGTGTQPRGEGLWTLWLSDHGWRDVAVGGGTGCPWMRGYAS